MPHVVLLGDSIFDNAAYVTEPDGESVIEALRDRLRRVGGDWRATLLAQDGATCSCVSDQAGRVPRDRTHLLLSVGGNDALMQAPLISGGLIGDPASLMQPSLPDAEPTTPKPAPMSVLAAAQAQFMHDYRTAVSSLSRLGLPLGVCTVYDAVPGLEPPLKAGLSLFNDVIVRLAAEHRLPVLDLRLVCDQPQDYSSLSPIEPSGRGSAKIARGLIDLLLSHEFDSPRCVVYGG